MNIGERIQYFRKQKNITVNKLANLAGVSQSYVRNLELGNTQPTIEYLSYICDALNISLEQFFLNSEKNDELDNLIYQLNDNQKDTLIAFLKEMLAK